MKMKGYKGFDKNLKCRDKQYTLGKKESENETKICEKGMHFCELPHEVFNYYSAGNGNRFCEVEAEEVSDEIVNDSKRVAKRLLVKTEISAFDICKMAVSVFFEKFGFKNKIKSAETTNAGDYGAANAGDRGAANAGYCGAANAGYYGAANAGYQGAANAGYCGAANAGDRGAANAGYRGAANAGYCGAANAGDQGAANAGYQGAANAGDRGAANAGDCGAANAGDRGAANAGDYGAANAGDYGAANAGDQGAANAGDQGAANAGDCGAANAGDCGAAIVLNNGRVKGGYGCVLVARNIEWNDANSSYEITDWACGIVDNITIKENTWYELLNGRLVKCENQ